MFIVTPFLFLLSVVLALTAAFQRVPNANSLLRPKKENVMALGLRPWHSLTTLLLFFSLLLAENALAAQITVQPAQGPAGTNVTVNGAGWPAGDLIEFSWNFDYQLTVGNVKADNKGNFITGVVVSQGAPQGPTYLDAGDQAAFLTAQAPFTVTSQSPIPQPPSPGWHGNNVPSIIYDDKNGRKIIWQNSYIYPHPGTDNLYWYAEVIYVNDGKLPWSISCSTIDPTVVKEYIRNTEGLPPGVSAYVPADETFCSRNRSFQASIKSGGVHYSWAIFHNVPPGGEVSIEWSPYKPSPWADPWRFPFPPGSSPPRVCPPELVRLGTCQEQQAPPPPVPEPVPTPVPTPVPPPGQECLPQKSCIPREYGENARWWATSWKKGTCTNQTDENWIVTYGTDNETWRSADVSRIRFYAALWSKYLYIPQAAKAQAEHNTPPGIVLCLSLGYGLMTENDVKGTWVWLRP